MVNIVFVVGEYHPFFSAVGVCCRNIAEAIQADGHTVTVICMKSRAGQLRADRYQGERIVRVTTHSWSIRLWLEERIRRSADIKGTWLRGLLSAWLHLLLNTLRVLGAMRSLSSKTSIDRARVQAFLEGLALVEEPIDLLIPLCFPMEAVVAGMEYADRHPRTRFVPYLFDPFVDSRTMHRTALNMRLKRRRHMAIEMQMMARASRVFCVSHLMVHFRQYDRYAHKLVATEHPLLRKPVRTDPSRRVTSCRVNLVYAGVFDSRVRNPDYFLRVMLEVLPGFDGQLDLFVSGNCAKVIDMYCESSGGRIRNHGYAPKEEVDCALMSSDILVGVGNRGTSQVSSKIIEYASTGKPILYFFSEEEDPGCVVLQRYPLSSCLREENRLFRENVRLVAGFCRSTAGDELDFADISRIYFEARPEFVAHKLLENVA